MWIHWPFFPKTWTKGHWPLDDLWPHVCWGHMCDSTQGSLCPSPMGIHQCMWIQWSILQITTYIHTHTSILRTYYVQNECSHSLLLNSFQARQKLIFLPFQKILPTKEITCHFLKKKKQKKKKKNSIFGSNLISKIDSLTKWTFSVFRNHISFLSFAPHKTLSHFQNSCDVTLYFVSDRTEVYALLQFRRKLLATNRRCS